MNYFNDGCILLLNDFSDFCKQCNEDFDVDHAKSLIESFLQSRQTMQGSVAPQGPQSRQLMQNAEVSTSSSVGVIPKKLTKSSKSATRSKNAEISVEEFNKLSIDEIKTVAWSNKNLVSTLKELCIKLGLLPVAKQTKTQIIDNLIQYKTSQNQDSDETPPEEEEKKEVSEPSTQKPKRRVIASAIVKPVVTITKSHGLNLVFCDDDDIILVLSEDHQLCGFIPKEEYSEDDTPPVLKVTKNVIRVAKNMGIAYEVPETIE